MFINPAHCSTVFKFIFSDVSRYPESQSSSNFQDSDSCSQWSVQKISGAEVRSVKELFQDLRYF